MIHLDFETRSEAEIWDVGAWEYAAHPSTEILCMAYAIDDGPVKILPREHFLWNLPCPEDLEKAIRNDFLIMAHNAFFERCIWYHLLRNKWVCMGLHQWRCSMAKANACALPKSLKDVGEALKLKTTKSIEGKRIMLKLSRPRKATKNNSAFWHEDPEDFKKLYKYCIDDVEAERAVHRALPDLSEKEQEVWFLDQKINARGVQIDREAVDAALEIVSRYAEILNHEVVRLTGGFLDGVSRTARILKFLNYRGVHADNVQKLTIDNLLKGELPDDVRRVLEIRRQLAKTSVKKYNAIKNATMSEPRLRDNLLYHSATTGRWGGKLVQLQNLPRGNIKDTDTCVELIKRKDLKLLEFVYGDVMGAISSSIRGMIIAKSGHDLIVADYSAIEARVLLWLADDRAGLAKYRRGEDLYVDMAKVIYIKQEEITETERWLGKKVILGCGFGMGPSKFRDSCINEGLEVSEELAEKSVRAYRSLYPGVRNLWYAQERAAIRALRHKGEVIMEGRVKWAVRGQFLVCQLPSGRSIVYYRPSIRMALAPWGEMKETIHFWGTNSQTKQFEEQRTYGGKLVENITQASARDIMAYAMLRAEEADYRIILTVHDELVAEVPNGFGSVDEFCDIICRVDRWADGCPISAEGWRGKRYKKG